MKLWLDAHLSPQLVPWLATEFGLGSPPQVLWLTLGNTSNRYLREVLKSRLPIALGALERGEPVVELTEAG